MAQKRMFSKDVVRTDKFLDMSLSSQALYFHLCMDADVKGFVTPRSIMRMINSTADDLNVLITKGFVIPFESGVVVVTHWNVNNQIRETHEAPTQHIKELAQLIATEQGLYQLQEDYSSTTVELPHSIDKIRLDKVRLEEREQEEKPNEEDKLKLGDLLSLDSSLKEKYKNKYEELTQEEIISESEKAYHWCKANGKRYKDYNSFLMNWLSKAVSYKKLQKTKSSNFAPRRKGTLR